MNFHQIQKTYTVDDIAKILGLNVSTIYACLSRRELVGFHQGRRRVITHEQFMDFLRRRNNVDFVDNRYATALMR